jgi:hypothetical protein
MEKNRAILSCCEVWCFFKLGTQVGLTAQKVAKVVEVGC